MPGPNGLTTHLKFIPVKARTRIQRIHFQTTEKVQKLKEEQNNRSVFYCPVFRPSLSVTCITHLIWITGKKN